MRYAQRVWTLVSGLLRESRNTRGSSWGRHLDPRCTVTLAKGLLSRAPQMVRRALISTGERRTLRRLCFTQAMSPQSDPSWEQEEAWSSRATPAWTWQETQGFLLQSDSSQLLSTCTTKSRWKQFHNWIKRRKWRNRKSLRRWGCYRKSATI